MKNLEEKTISMFESIKHTDENGKEYWEARELQKVLQYEKWQKFKNVLNSAKISCKKSNINISYHFTQVGKMVEIGSKTKRIIDDYRLSRYACYLIAQNADSRKKVVALAQTYFAVQTRKMELLEKDYNMLSEDEKRLYQRNLTRKGNNLLNKTARDTGVRNFDRFHNYGYKGLYGGETANDISKRKGLRYREDILDNMGSSELIANLFRIDLTNQKLVKDKVQGESNANATHYNVGRKVRKTIKELGGTLPENLPKPDKSLKTLIKEKNNRIKCKD